MEGGPERQADSTKGRCLRRTVSVPSEGQFPEYPPEGAAKLGKLLKGKTFPSSYPVINGLVIECDNKTKHPAFPVKEAR